MAFRDYPQAHPRVAAEYEALKRRSAEEHPDDRATYTRTKAGFIERVLDHALDEYE